MKFGVDFGTTRIIVAAVDRGNYPLVSFETPEGVYDWFPSLIALTGSGRDMEMKFGWDAWQVQADPSWTVIRSVKRFLEGAGSQTAISADGREVPLIELLAGLTRALRLKLI